jgi:hypothetical protein
MLTTKDTANPKVHNPFPFTLEKRVNPKLIRRRPTVNTIKFLFIGADMRCQHAGMLKIAQSKKEDLTKLKQGEHAVFMNNERNKIKLYSVGGLLSYLKLHRNGRVTPELIESIPECFNANGTVNWDKAQRVALEKELTRKRVRKAKKNA